MLLVKDCTHYDKWQQMLLLNSKKSFVETLYNLNYTSFVRKLRENNNKTHTQPR